MPTSTALDDNQTSATGVFAQDDDDNETTSISREQLEALKAADAHSDRRLAFLVFMATLAGNLIALVAGLADATSLIVPVLDLVSPVPSLTIAGSTTILGPELQLTEDWIQDYRTLNMVTLNLPIAGEVERTTAFYVEAVGTLRGVELAAAHRAQLLAASEAFGPNETAQLASVGVTIACAAPIGYDVIAFVTDITNSLTRPLVRAELVGLLSGKIQDWSEVGGPAGPITVFAREGSGTTDLVLREYLGQSELPPHIFHCHSQADCLNLTLSTPGSLYWVSAAWLQTQPNNYLRPVLVELGDGPAANPLSEEFRPERYPSELVRPLYMYVLEHPQINPRSTELGRHFLAYVRGTRGQQLLEEHHFYTYFDPPAGVALQLPPGFGPQVGAPPVVCRADTSAGSIAAGR